MESLLNRLKASGPKRILALDGGGIRGILTVQILREIEKRERKANSDPTLVLADSFDLIGGTSTGAIIAALVALGKNIDEIEALYKEVGEKVFKKRPVLGLIFPKYSTKALEKVLRRELGNMTLGSGSLKTGLAVIAKRVDTGSVWVFNNHPEGKYFNASVDEGETYGNGDYNLAEIVRASTAAGHYFKPEHIEIHKNEKPGLFVDGGMSPHNNPAFQLFLLATLKGFPFHWQTGEAQLSITSVGTGTRTPKVKSTSWLNHIAGLHAVRSLESMMNDSQELNELLMQGFSRSTSARVIDGEVQDLKEDQIAGQPLFEYHRYDVHFEQKWMKEHLGMEMSEKGLDKVSQLDAIDQMQQLIEIGKRYAERIEVEGSQNA